MHTRVENCRKFPDRVIYNSQLKSIAAHNWKATWYHYSNVSYADIVKGTIHQAYGKTPVNCPLKVNRQLKANKVQNINSKVSNLGAHVVNTSFNTNKRVICAKNSSVQCKNVGKPREKVKLSTNCPVIGKKLNIGSCNVSNVNCGSNNKLQSGVNLARPNISQLQTNCVFNDVNRFACLQQVSDDNTWPVLSDSSTGSKNKVQNDCETVSHDVVSQSSNTRVPSSNCNVTSVKVNSNCKRLAKNPCRTWSVLSDSLTVSKNNVHNDYETVSHDVMSRSTNTRVPSLNCNVTSVKVNSNCKTLTNNPWGNKACDSVDSAVSPVTVSNPSINEAVQTVSDANFQSLKISADTDQAVKNSVDLNCDKYDLDLRFRPRHREAVGKAKYCKSFKDWDSQTSDKYGFIPLSDMMLPNKNRKNSSLATIFDIHRSIVDTNTHNFMEAQIEIKSQLNPDAWDKYLQNYWDQQLPLLIRYGFPLDFNPASPLHHEEINHASANLFVQDVAHYLKEETGFKAILGPFDSPPIKNMHISPFMTRPKPSSDHRRVIIDLSYPKGQSVNQGVSSEQYLNTAFILSLPTIDNITQKIRKYGKGSLIYKIDISRAFRHVKIDPDSYFLLGLKLDKYFLDTCLPFGYRHGSAIFQRISDSIRYIMAESGYSLTNYIDDLVGNATVSQTEPAFQKLKNLLQELGLTISETKLVAPTTKCVCLGIEVDTVNSTLSIPQQKLAEILTVCQQWENKNKCTRKELQSLLGSLLYIAKCVRYSRNFLNRMLELLRQTHKDTTINLTPGFIQDLAWFLKFAPKFNGTSYFNHAHVHAKIELDASLEGLGAYFNDQIYAIPLVRGYNQFHIVQLEMLNVLVAVRVWANQWNGKTIVIACDNQAVVSVINTGKTKDVVLAAIARNIATEVALSDINLRLIHILGKNNIVADSLSRYYTSDLYKNNIKNLLPHATWVVPADNTLLIDYNI